MKKKQLLSILLTAVMALSLTACGNSGNTPQESAASNSTTTPSTESSQPAGTEAADTSSQADPFGKYADPLEIHFVRATDDTIETNVLANLPGQTLEDNFWLDTYEEELGIKVVYDWIVKGDDELIISRDDVFIVNIPHNVVVTMVPYQEMKENIFTNIDSAVLIDPWRRNYPIHRSRSRH